MSRMDKFGYYQVGLEHVRKITPDSLKRDQNKIEKGFKPFNSKIYEIGE